MPEWVHGNEGHAWVCLQKLSGDIVPPDQYCLGKNICFDNVWCDRRYAEPFRLCGFACARINEMMAKLCALHPGTFQNR